MGRPEKPIDWALVDKLLEAQCNGEMIAGHFDMHADTLYAHIKRKYGLTFTAFSASRKEKGKASILAMQYQRAMQGNTQMLLRLGELYCNQGKQETSNKESLIEYLEQEASEGEHRSITFAEGQEMAPESPLLDQRQTRTQDQIQTELGARNPDIGSSST